MKYTAQDESLVANITKPSAIFVTKLSSRAVYFHTNKVLDLPWIQIYMAYTCNRIM